jgi:hypothetical protein
MVQNSVAAALIEEIRVSLPAKTYYRTREREEALSAVAGKLLGASSEDLVEFVLASLRIAHQEQTLLADVLNKAASDVLRRKLTFTSGQVLEMLQLISVANQVFPFKSVLKAVESVAMTPEMGQALRGLRPCITEYLGGSEMRDLHARIDILLNGPAPATALQPQGAWSQLVLEEIAASPHQAIWERIFHHAAESKTSEPSKKWLAAADTLARELGRAEFLEHLVRWLALGPSPQRPGVQLSSGETELQKGLLWFLAGDADARLPALIAAYAEQALKKIPMLGAVSQKVGNACVNVLAELPGMAPVSQLSGLAQRIRYDTAQRLIEEALSRAAVKAGVSREEIEEMSVSGYGLGPDGAREQEFGDYKVRIAIVDTTSVTMEWSDAQAKPLKGVPSYVKEHHAEAWKDLQRAAKEMEKTLTAQRARIETLLLTQRAIPIATLTSSYLGHALLGDMSRRLIWQFDSGPGIWYEGRMVDSAEREIDLSREQTARLWHPITSEVETILHWRCWLEDHGVCQPFKQAHREVYMITEAERETRTYSNRFAAHILRQHQFAALCEERGWTFHLMGQWDSHNTPRLALAQYGLRVQYEVDFPQDESEVSGHAIYLLIRSDKVRFLDNANMPRTLDSIPPVVFSEVMRDVDLFTAAASIGMDPAWDQRDRAAFRAYWSAFSFGELTEMAINRRSVLERLIPRLAIADRCILEPRFLKVRGDRTEYRIHLNSGNILMEPDSRYLCIVQGAADKSTPRNLPLPFEGDRVLSLILSKAFLLAGDRHIKDDKILRQLPPLPVDIHSVGRVP